MTLSSNNNVNAPRINIPHILLPDRLQTLPLLDPITQNTDLFVFAQLPNATTLQPQQIAPVQNQQLPNASTNTVQHPTGRTTTQTNEIIRFLITNLNLQLHSSGNYFTSSRQGSNPNDRYYPQLNGTFFVTGTTPQGETIQSTITNFLNGEPVRSTANIPFQHTLLLGQLRAFTANGFNFNPNGTLTSPLHNGVTLHCQLDGSLWGSNNTTYRLASNGTSVEQQTGTTPLPFTTFFSQPLSLIDPRGTLPLRLQNTTSGSGQILGGFLRPDDIGTYILEPGGTIFYTGRNITGQGRLGPYVYRQLPNGTWEIDHAATANRPIDPITHLATPLPGAVALANARAYQDANGNWFAPSDDNNPDPYAVRMLPDGRVIKFRGSHPDFRMFVFNSQNNTWTQLSNLTTNLTHSDRYITAAVYAHRTNNYPQVYNSPLPALDSYVTALRTNLQNNNCTNIQLSGRLVTSGRFNWEHQYVTQMISFTQGGSTHYRLLQTALGRDGRVVGYREFDFPQSEIQRIATHHNMPTINWANVNDVHNLLAFFFREDNVNSNYFSLDSYGRGISQGIATFGDIQGLRERGAQTSLVAADYINPLTTSTRRLAELPFNAPRVHSNSSDDPQNVFRFSHYFGSRSIFHSTPITNPADIQRRDEIITAFNQQVGNRRFGFRTFTRTIGYHPHQSTINCILAVGDNEVQLIEWYQLDGRTRFHLTNYTRESINNRLGALRESAGIDIPNFMHAQHQNNSSQYLQELNIFSNHVSIILFNNSLLRGDASRPLRGTFERCGSTIADILNPANNQNIQ